MSFKEYDANASKNLTIFKAIYESRIPRWDRSWANQDMGISTDIRKGLRTDPWYRESYLSAQITVFRELLLLPSLRNFAVQLGEKVVHSTLSMYCSKRILFHSLLPSNGPLPRGSFPFRSGARQGLKCNIFEELPCMAGQDKSWCSVDSKAQFKIC